MRPRESRSVPSPSDRYHRDSPLGSWPREAAGHRHPGPELVAAPVGWARRAEVPYRHQVSRLRYFEGSGFSRVGYDLGAIREPASRGLRRASLSPQCCITRRTKRRSCLHRLACHGSATTRALTRSTSHLRAPAAELRASRSTMVSTPSSAIGGGGGVSGSGPSNYSVHDLSE
jgi:hypothetical protein